MRAGSSARWGVNRSVAQGRALLCLADEPPPAEEIAGTPRLARANLSTAVRELGSFAPVSVEHRPGDRRDFVRAKQDPPDMVLAIVEERKPREIDPALGMVRGRESEAAADGGATPLRRRPRRRGAGVPRDDDAGPLAGLPELLPAGQRAVPARALGAGYRFRSPTLAGAPADPLRRPGSSRAGVGGRPLAAR